MFRQGGEKLLKRLESYCNSLHTLALEANSSAFFESAFPIFSLNFPQLRSLSLRLLVIKDAETAMAFWQRHPTLEYLKVVAFEQKTHWFTNELPRKFLPNLIHLRVSNELMFSYDLMSFSG